VGEGDTRQYSVQNYHVLNKKRNVSSTISMPPIGKDDPMGCLSCPAPHSIAESLREGQPIVINLSDQTFPPVLPPTGDGNCTVIIRVEDCELWELEEVFTDRFKASCKPHGNLPSGSIILVGSMSHLAKNGLNFYAPILVETMTRMAGKVGPGVNVIPLLPIPVGGIGSETLVWDMMDLDCWIVSTGAGQATGLPDSRDTFWQVILEAGVGGRRVYTSSPPLSLPGGIKNPRTRPFVSRAYAGTIPAEILPLDPEVERALVGSLLTELNEKFCVNLDPNPSLDRSIPPPPTAHNTGRTVFIGGSNLGRIAKAAGRKWPHDCGPYSKRLDPKVWKN
jgi:hypothetical protein